MSASPRKRPPSSRARATRGPSRAASKLIKRQIEETDSDYDREKLQERLAKLAGGVAVIQVGAATETELKEKKHRIEDAVHATRAAVEEGIVPGGGTTLINIIPALDKLEAEGDEKVGIHIVRRALAEPLRHIADNAGLEGSVIVERVKNEPPGIGFNAATEEFVDMVKAGIVDPAKVTRTALQNAASIAGMLLTTEAVISEIPKKEKAPAMPGAATWTSKKELWQIQRAGATTPALFASLERDARTRKLNYLCRTTCRSK